MGDITEVIAFQKGIKYRQNREESYIFLSYFFAKKNCFYESKVVIDGCYNYCSMFLLVLFQNIYCFVMDRIRRQEK